MTKSKYAGMCCTHNFDDTPEDLMGSDPTRLVACECGRAWVCPTCGARFGRFCRCMKEEGIERDDLEPAELVKADLPSEFPVDESIRLAQQLIDCLTL